MITKETLEYAVNASANCKGAKAFWQSVFDICNDTDKISLNKIKQLIKEHKVEIPKYKKAKPKASTELIKRFEKSDVDNAIEILNREIPNHALRQNFELLMSFLYGNKSEYPYSLTACKEHCQKHFTPQELRNDMVEKMFEVSELDETKTFLILNFEFIIDLLDWGIKADKIYFLSDNSIKTYIVQTLFPQVNILERNIEEL